MIVWKLRLFRWQFFSLLILKLAFPFSHAWIFTRCALENLSSIYNTTMASNFVNRCISYSLLYRLSFSFEKFIILAWACFCFSGFSIDKRVKNREIIWLIILLNIGCYIVCERDFVSDGWPTKWKHKTITLCGR